MLSLEGHKGVSLSVMFVITLFTSLSPIYVRKLFLKHVKGKAAEISLSGCLCFGAGVLMATIFLHILPEAVETVEGAMADGIMASIKYPITQISLCMGFFLVYFVEELVHYCIDRRNKIHSKSSDTIQLPHREANMNEGYLNEEPYNNNQKEEVSCSPHMHDHGDTHAFLKNVSLVGSLIVVVALSFHGFMEGMALGLEHTPQDVWLMFAALCTHKIFISFSMSMELLEIGVPLKVLVVSMLIFDAASPIGGMIGAIITANSAESDSAASVLAPAFLQAISAGTILYVTFCEVLERERAKNGGGLVKFACLLGGFSVMAALQTLDHDEEESSSDPTDTTIAKMLQAVTDPVIFVK